MMLKSIEEKLKTYSWLFQEPKTYPKGSVHTKLKINHLVTKPNFGPLQNFLKTISKLLSDCIKITIRLVQDYLMSSRWLWYHFIIFLKNCPLLQHNRGHIVHQGGHMLHQENKENKKRFNWAVPHSEINQTKKCPPTKFTNSGRICRFAQFLEALASLEMVMSVTESESLRVWESVTLFVFGKEITVSPVFPVI